MKLQRTSARTATARLRAMTLATVSAFSARACSARFQDTGTGPPCIQVPPPPVQLSQSITTAGCLDVQQSITTAGCFDVQLVLLQAQQMHFFCVVHNWDGARMEEFIAELPPGDESLSDFLEYARPSLITDASSTQACQWRFAVVPGPQAPPAFVQLFVNHVESSLQQLGIPNTELVVLPGPPDTNPNVDLALHDGQVFWSLAVANSGHIDVASLLLHMSMHYSTERLALSCERDPYLLWSLAMRCWNHCDMRGMHQRQALHAMCCFVLQDDTMYLVLQAFC